MIRPWHGALGALLLATAGGCAGLERPGGLWLAPPLEPAARPAAPPPAQVAALGSASAGTPGLGRLGLEDVLAAVEASYPLLGAARVEATLAEARQLSALGGFDPLLRGGTSWAPEGYYENHSAQVRLEQPTGLWGAKVWGGYRLGRGDFDPTWDGKRFTNHGGELAAGVSLPLLRDGAIDAARRELYQSSLARSQTEAEIAQRRLDFFREAALAYWRWVVAGQRLEIVEALLRVSEERQEAVRIRAQRGDLPQVDTLDNERLVVGRRALRVAARRGLEQAAWALSLFLRDAEGRPSYPSPAALPEELPGPAAPRPEGLLRDVASALERRPDLRRLGWQREQLQVERDYRENQLLPELDLTLAASQDLDRSRPSPTKGPFELVLGLELGFPLLNRGARGAARAAEARLEQLALQEQFLRERVEAEVRDAFSAVVAAWERIGEARRAAELARQLAEAERRRFELGDVTLVVLNLREEAAAEAELRLLEALGDYWSMAAGYRWAVGAEPSARFQSD